MIKLLNLRVLSANVRLYRYYALLAGFLTVACLFFNTTLTAQRLSDSLPGKKIKEPRHYFMSTFYFDYYSTAKTTLVNLPKYNYWTKKLGTYQFSQSSGGFFIPVYTRDYNKGDSVAPANLHILATGSYLLAMPRFSGIHDHTIFKGSIGMRGIYNTGKRGVFFMNYGIFAAQDISFPSDSVVLRSVTTLLYDHIVNEKFSFRIGYSKTFILGNRFRLPYLGFRVGRLDKTYLSVQFPRNITLSFPMGSKFRGALFTKPMGGLYTFANTDTLYYMGNEKKIHFGWREISSGLKLEYYPGKNFSFNLSMGTATNGIIGMSSFGFNRNKFNALQPFYFDRLDKRGFVYVGMTLRFGKAKKVYNSRNIYEVFDLNNTIDAGDNNSDPGNGNIPKSTKKNKIRNLQISDVQDLIETQDLY